MKRSGALVALLCCCGISSATAGDASLDGWRHVDAAVQSFVLVLARRAFNEYVTRREVIEAPGTLPSILRQRAGVFVSTMRNGAPRCCMGTIYPTEPDAAREIIANAVTAAGRDHRFPPIKASELKGLTLIVSIVGNPHPITPSELPDLNPAHEGLVVKSGSHLGVVLSGETGQVERMVRWGRIRAGASPTSPVELLRMEDVRFVEGR